MHRPPRMQWESASTPAPRVIMGQPGGPQHSAKRAGETTRHGGGAGRAHRSDGVGSHLPAAAPLSADQAASAVTAPASALSASSGTSSSMAECSGGGGGPEDAPELGRRR